MSVRTDIGGRVVAIDGPGGVGKSSVSRALAGRLGYAHLDTGAFYRAAALLIVLHGVDFEDEAAVISSLASATLDYRGTTMLVEEVDMTSAIRGESIGSAASRLATHPAVRRLLVSRQRQWVADRRGRCVVEGRDIGTVVFPHAGLSIYLDAAPSVRALRRARESGRDIDTEAEELRGRDERDVTRSAAPLMVADGAVMIDTTELNIAEVVDKILRLCQQRGLGGHATT